MSKGWRRGGVSCDDEEGAPLTYILTARPKMIALFVLVSLATMSVASFPGYARAGVTLAGIALLAAGAATLNGCLERELDRRMARTAGRPLASGRLQPSRALVFAALVTTAGLVLLAAGPGLDCLLLGLGGMIAYVGLYTVLLKPRFPESVVWGSPSGLFPLLIAWTATEEPWSPALLYCCLVVFFWSPAHFWSLALARAEEYREVGVPVLPVVSGERATGGRVLVYLLVLLVLPIWGVATGLFRAWLVVVNLAACLPLVWLALRLVAGASPSTAWWLFRLSGPYLAVVFVALVLARGT